jgi:hypothetical protein
MISYGFTEEGKFVLEDICEDGRAVLSGSITGDGRIVPIFMIFSSDIGSWMEEETGEKQLELMLKLLQGKKITMELSQDETLLLRPLQDKNLVMVLSQVGRRKRKG